MTSSTSWQTRLAVEIGEHERLGLGSDREPRVLEQLPQPLPHLGPTRLADRERLVAERVAEHARLGGLARAVDAFESHEQAGHQEPKLSARVAAATIRAL